MKTFIYTTIALILPFISSAQDKGLDQKIDEAFQPVADAFFDAIFFIVYEGDTFSIPFVLVLLVGSALFFKRTNVLKKFCFTFFTAFVFFRLVCLPF